MFSALTSTEICFYVLLPIFSLFLFAYYIATNYSGKEEGIPLNRIRKKIPGFLKMIMKYQRDHDIKTPLWTRTSVGYKCTWGKEMIDLTSDTKHQKLVIKFGAEELLQLFFAGDALMNLKFGAIDLREGNGVEEYRKSAWALLQDVREKVGLPRHRRGSSVASYMKSAQSGAISPIHKPKD